MSIAVNQPGMDTRKETKALQDIGEAEEEENTDNNLQEDSRPQEEETQLHGLSISVSRALFAASHTICIFASFESWCLFARGRWARCGDLHYRPSYLS